MNNTTKTKLSEFTVEEARGWVIDSFNQIDWRLNKLIVDFFKPSEKEKFESIVLNTSIIDIGGKLKIIRSIGLLKPQIIDKIRNLASVRNGFAHSHTSISIKIELAKDTSKSNVASSERMIEVMNSNGELKSKKVLDYLIEFNDLFNEIIKELNKYIE